MCCLRVLVDVVAAAIVLGSLTTTNRRAIMMRVCVFECLFLVLFIFTMSFFNSFE